MRKLQLKRKIISDISNPYIIAEVGHNHQGNIDLCKKIFAEAKEAGASAVKIQKRNNKELFTKKMYNSRYSSPNSYAQTYGKHREKLEFGSKEYKELIRYCKKIKIDFFSTAFDISSAKFLIKLKLYPIKIASGDSSNFELIGYIAKKKIPMIISTGGSSIHEIKKTYNFCKKYYNNFAILQCTSGYPPSFNQLNLNVIPMYRSLFPDIIIGYSGHENGISIPVSAFTLGARIIEKHFTIDRTLKGTDQSLSLSPSGLKRMCRDLNRVNLALGKTEKKFLDCEIEPLSKMMKLLVSKKKLKKNSVIGYQDIVSKVTGSINGYKTYQSDLIIGKKLSRSIEAEHIFSKKDFK